MRGRLLSTLVLVSIVVVGLPSGGAARPAAGGLRDATVTIGSFDFAESELLAEIYAQALEGDIDVRRAFRVGPREVVLPALARGLVELVPEYAGTALRFASLGRDDDARDIASIHPQLVRALGTYRATARQSCTCRRCEHVRRHAGHRRPLRTPHAE